MTHFRRFSRRRLSAIQEIEFPTLYNTIQRVKNFESGTPKTSVTKSRRLLLTWTCGRLDRGGSAV